MPGADNQQERLDGYISGYVDGEGCFAVAVNRNPTCRTGFQLVPEFHVSQNGDRSQVLELIRQRFGGSGYIKSNGRKDRALVYVVRRREDLLTHVLPFFERSPLLSSKQEDFETFAAIVRAMAGGVHRTPPSGVWHPTAALVVEIVSPSDESWEKLPFYAAHHVDEVLIVDPQERSVSWLALEDGEYHPIEHSGFVDLEAQALAEQLDWPRIDEG